MRGSYVVVVGILCAFAAPATAQDTTAVRRLMTPAEFRAAGLHKLTPTELAALYAWFRRTAAAVADFTLKSAAGRRPGAGGSNPATSNADLLASLEGASIVAEDGQFLGKITVNSVDPQSLLNAVGRYGSEISSTSIFNKIGRYGSDISPMSPFNQIASTPPRIVRNGQVIGYLTVNEIKTPRLDPRALVGMLRAAGQ